MNTAFLSSADLWALTIVIVGISIFFFCSSIIVLQNLWISEQAKPLILKVLTFLCIGSLSIGISFYLHDTNVLSIESKYDPMMGSYVDSDEIDNSSLTESLFNKLTKVSSYERQSVCNFLRNHNHSTFSIGHTNICPNTESNSLNN
jgi:hypothetical protein